MGVSVKGAMVMGKTAMVDQPTTFYLSPDAEKPLAELAIATLTQGRPKKLTDEQLQAFHSRFACEIAPVITRIRREWVFGSTP